MQYCIEQLANTSNSINYWTDVLDSNNVVFSTTDLVVLEAKLEELLLTIPRSKLRVYTPHTLTIDPEVV